MGGPPSAHHDTTIPREKRPARPVSGRAELFVAHSPDAQVADQAFALPAAGETLVVGRSVAPGLTIEDKRLSRLHFRVVWDAVQNGYRLGDAGSANGCFVDGESTRTHLLQDGDVIRAGDTVFVYREVVDEQSTEELSRKIAPSPHAVLIRGETGVGKEVMAKRLHELSGRKGPFVALNCATLPRELLASELFGHVRGAFSGASAERPGLFVAADRGTLFLDEIGDLPLEQQPALLRVLQERSVRPVGSERQVQVDVRVVSATHVDLEAAVLRGAFRGDLLARLCPFVIELLPLRERRAELLSLLRDVAREEGVTLGLTPDAAEALLLWSYPYNVRDVQAIVRAFSVLGGGSLLDLDFLEQHEPELVAAGSFNHDAEAQRDSRSPTERRELIESLLVRHQGNVSLVAKALGKPRGQLYRWMTSLGLAAERYRER
jgi:transcriptional regulator with GAF, ATPase, and Fis domain